MRKFKIATNPSRLSDVRLEDLFDDIDPDWELKAQRLRTRRWRKLKQQLI